MKLEPSWLETIREHDKTWRDKKVPLKQRIVKCRELHLLSLGAVPMGKHP